jgi:hypothetical protein
MKTRLIIVADLGLLRAYRVVQNRDDRSPHLELLEELQPEIARTKWRDQLTDQAGRFPRGDGANHVPGSLSAGERHDLREEQQRRIIGRLTERINALLADDDVAMCSLAASAPIHRVLLKGVHESVRPKITQILASDLAKTEPKQLLRHFQQAS